MIIMLTEHHTIMPRAVQPVLRACAKSCKQSSQDKPASHHLSLPLKVHGLPKSCVMLIPA